MSHPAQSALRGVGLGWRREIAPDLLRTPEAVDFVEVVAENCAVDAGARREALAIAELWPVVPHGVKLSLGSADGIDPARARRLGRLARDLRAPLLSEHVAFTRTRGHDIGHLTTLPWTRDAVAVVARNLATARRHFPDIPCLLENVAWTFRWPEDEMAEGDFYAEIVAAAGCELLLDVGNLYANAVNARQSPSELLRSFPLEHVAMLHVAGGASVEGFYEDTHAHPVPEPVFALVDELFARVGSRPVLLERDAGFGPFGTLAGEVARLRRMAEAADRPAEEEPPARRRPVPASIPDGVAALAARQRQVAEMLTGSTHPLEDEASPFGVGAMARTRAMLLHKRVDEALPLLPRLAPHENLVRPLALRVLRDRPRAPRAAGIADAWAVVGGALAEAGTASEARLDRLALRARFCGLARGGAIAPRWTPFLGLEALPDGTRVCAVKGVGRDATVHLIALPRIPQRPKPKPTVSSPPVPPIAFHPPESARPTGDHA